MLKRLFAFTQGYRHYAVLAPLSVVAEVLLEVSIPLIMAKIINIGIPAADLSYIIRQGLLMMAMALCSLFFGAAAARFAALAGTGFGQNLRQKLFYAIEDFSFENIDHFSTASLVTRLTTDVNNTQMAFMMSIRMLVRSPVMLVCAILMASSINSELTVIFLVAAPVLAGVLALIMSKAHGRFQAMLRRYDGMNSAVQEDLIGIRVVKAFVREDYENERFTRAADQVRQAQIRAEKLIMWNMPCMQFVMYACMLAIAWFGGNRIIAGSMLTGDLMSFISYTSQILMSLMMVGMVFINLVLSRASVQRIMEVLDEPVELTNPEHPITQIPDGSIRFENVDFSYTHDSQNLTLSNVNLDIPSGATVGVIGGTGSSKTTFVQLIPRLYDPLHGRVLVGGHDVRDYDLSVLRDGVAMVLQKNVLFSGTIGDNLRWGNPKATDQELEAACRAACAHDFIQAFPKGYDTELGQGGVNVSGGQKQRLCIARALLKRPKIMILDDSTSAVDTATDAAIRSALTRDLKEMTTIIIAQRIASVEGADQIVVLDEGKIVDVGQHHELLARCPIYREAYETQRKGAE